MLPGRRLSQTRPCQRDRTSAVARSILTLAQTCTFARAIKALGPPQTVPLREARRAGLEPENQRAIYQRGRGAPPTLRDW